MPVIFPKIFETNSIVFMWNSPLREKFQGSECVSGSGCGQSFGYDRGFWICFRFWIWQGYTEFRICLNSSWVCQNVADYAWICLNISEYAGICVNMPKSAWMAFVLYYPIYSFVLQSPFYLNTWLLIWTSTGD